MTPGHRPARGPRRALVAVLATLGALGATLVVSVPLASSSHAEESESVRTDLYLVTLDGPGLSGTRGPLPRSWTALQQRAERERVLRLVDAPEPVYTWATALNGFAVRLSEDQAAEVAADPAVALVEPNAVRRLAAAPNRAAAAAAAAPPGTLGGVDDAARGGGVGTVIGVVDTGIAPEGRLFSAVPRLGKHPEGFTGSCAAAEGWRTSSCNGKVVAASWYVAGFGEDRLSSTSVLSPRDTDGHGTEMASIAAGNSGVAVRLGGQDLGAYSGRAPRARLAVYKACWGAPEPADDGCATADLVSAIDRATSDGVDVLSLSVSGPPAFDTVERALLGAAEADVAVVAAAGNDGERTYAAHPGPWVTTVGATTSPARVGRVLLGDAPALTGAMVSTRSVGPARLSPAADLVATGADRAQARVCAPGSLDAARVADRIVLCERGGVGRVEKSRTVRLADGVGMVLVNTRRESVTEDFHSVPTVHLTAADGRRLVAWARRQPAATVSLRPGGVDRSRPEVTSWSAQGDPAAAVTKPDVVAPGTSVLAGVPDDGTGRSWDFVTGTSASTAYAAGVAATLVARRGLSADEVRSAMATTARPIAGTPVTGSGAGRLRPSRTTTPGLVHPVPAGAYRAWLSGRRTSLNTPSIRFAEGEHRARRTVTNISSRALYFSSRAVGFRREVRVTPAALRLAPGESATYTVTLPGRAQVDRLDDGYVVWRGAAGTVTRVPVLISR